MLQAFSAIASSGRFRACARQSGWGVVLLWLAASGSWSQLVSAQTPTQTTAAPREGIAARKTSSSRALAFEVAYPSIPVPAPITARVYVLLERGNSRLEPRFGPEWFRPEPFFARDVKGWKPTQTVRIDSAATGFPGPLDSLEPGDYTVQAVVRLNPDTHSIGTGEGNAYGPVVHAGIEPKATSTIRLEVDKLVPPRKFQETERIKLAELESPLLSAFYHRPIKHRAAVVLPAERPVGKLPTVYIIPGFGGDHHMAGMFVANSRMNYARDMVPRGAGPRLRHGPPCLCRQCHQRAAGPGPHRGIHSLPGEDLSPGGGPSHRLLNGHSSGGWSSLWLQVTYPGCFGGTWSTSPDPVDFRDFQRINIYAPGENMFCDRQGKSRPIARMGILPIIFYDRFSKMEEAMGPGGQLGSFEAVFSPLGRDGQPRKLWDRATGAIDPEVAKAWEAYDIRLVLERNWPTLGPKLSGKIHVITGGMDTFYLEGAAQLLKDSLAQLKSDAVVEIIPGRDHSTVLDIELARRLDREMKAAVAAFVDPK